MKKSNVLSKCGAALAAAIGALVLCPALAFAADQPAGEVSAPAELSVAVQGGLTATGNDPATPVDISTATVTISGTYAYTGSAIAPTATVVCSGKTLVANTDYTLACANNVNPGTATVTVTGQGNYTGTKTATFSIAKAQIAGAKVAFNPKNPTYTGKTLKPAATVTFGGKTLTAGTDYKIAYANNKNAGKATVTLTGKGKFTGTKAVNFTIKKARISKAKITKIVKYLTFNTEAQSQNPTVKFNGKKLVKGTDYKISYLNSSKKTIKAAKVKAAGIYYVKLAGKGNFTGTKSFKFKITKAKLADATVSNVKDYTYNGKVRAQKPVAKFNDKKLTKGKAYTIVYLNSKKKVIAAANVKDAGTYYVRLKGMGNFKGNVTKQFTINPKSISGASVQGVLNKIYNGAPQTQNPTVKLNGKLLQRDIDYTMSYWDNDNITVGTKWVAITGTGNYTDVVYGEYAINPMQISSTRIAYPRDMKYTGKAIQPKPTIIARLNGADVILKQGTDYEVGYRDNVRPGTGTMVISGIGNFDGTVLKTFTIKK